MGLFSGGRLMPNDVVDFLDNLTPFPQTTHVLYDDRTAQIHRPEVDLHSLPPPQKLRPVRFNSRNPPECSDPTDPEDGGLDGTLLNCYGVSSLTELGFLTQLSAQKLRVLNGGADECGGAPTDHGSGSLPDDSAVVAGNGCAVVDTLAVQRMKSEMDAECMNILSQTRLLETELSPSSDEGSESSEAIKEHLNCKRKRKARKKLESFLESMMRKVIQRQEEMHKQLIEMVENNEKERIIREEAWKQQQIERAKRDEELRAQETSRNLALISYIQDLLGRQIHIPAALETSCLEKDEGEIHNQEDFKCDPSNRRWPKSEVQDLITVRTTLDHKFLKGPKNCVWEEVSVGLANMGYSRTAKKCKEKWENINKYYKRTMENGKKRPDNGKSCPYFHQLDVLYKSGLITTGNSPNYIKNEIEDKNVLK